MGTETTRRTGKNNKHDEAKTKEIISIRRGGERENMIDIYIYTFIIYKESNTRRIE